VWQKRESFFNDCLSTMGRNGQLSVIILWTVLLCCHSNPAKRFKTNGLDHKEAVNLLFRFTRDAVPIKSVEKNSTEAANHSLWHTLFTKVKPPATDPPFKSHVTLVENKGPPIDLTQPNKDNTDKVSENGVKEQGPKFDDKAIQRAFMVFGGLCLILLVYFGLKYIFRRKLKGDGRYGLVDSSEMDLLESNDDAEEEEEDDTLYDVHAHRRT